MKCIKNFFLPILLLIVVINTVNINVNAKTNENEKFTVDRISELLNESNNIQTITVSESYMLEQMLKKSQITKQELKNNLKSLSKYSKKSLKNLGYTNEQITDIQNYNGVTDPITYIKASSTEALVSFTYGLAGSDNTKRRVRIGYEIKWSKCPLFTFTDSYGIGWIAADKNSHELATKIVSSSGAGLLYTIDGEYVGSRLVSMNNGSAGVVRGNIAIGQASGAYVKRIGGVIIVETQSGSYNMDTIQIFVGYAHTVLSLNISAGVTIDFTKASGVISFYPTAKQDLLITGSYVFRYYSQNQHTDEEN